MKKRPRLTANPDWNSVNGYTLRLHLGMNSVKLDADVGEAWEEGDDIYP